ncbi:MAG: threonine dehydratase [Actinomycetota bacterium]|nr:threonine dehydratase [Actinomycetota bacterium]
MGTDVRVKHENFNPTGAFKVRGGINLVSAEADALRDIGVTAASTGNHGQSVAFAANLFGVESHICVPENANPVKVRAMRDLGAEVIFHGKDFDDAREHCQSLAGERGYRYVHSGDEPLLIEGVGTHTLEILEDRPETEVIIVPIGGGSGAAGACITAKALDPTVKVIGVQSEAAPAAYLSWKSHSMIEDEMNTSVEGLATRTAFALPQSIMWELLDDFVLVPEADIHRATVTMIEHTRTLVEGAGAAALAAGLALKDRLAGTQVVLICSGSNITPDQLRGLFGEG